MIVLYSVSTTEDCSSIAATKHLQEAHNKTSYNWLLPGTSNHLKGILIIDPLTIFLLSNLRDQFIISDALSRYKSMLISGCWSSIY